MKCVYLIGFLGRRVRGPVLNMHSRLESRHLFFVSDDVISEQSKVMYKDASAQES